MNRALILVVALFFSLVGVLAFLFPVSSGLVEIYSSKLQVPLFTGFLTLGGFLLSLKTFILIKLKEGLYDHQNYKNRLNKYRAANPEANISHYGPLARLSTFLIYSVGSALVTAVAQLTIGFVPGRLPVLICLALAGITAVLVAVAWWQIRASLNHWFEILEEDVKDSQ